MKSVQCDASCCIRTDGRQKDSRDAPISRFRNFANTPKIVVYFTKKGR